MRLFFAAICCVTLGLLVVGMPVHAYDSKARALFVVDYDTGTVLLEKNADQPLPPASMSKLMTINMVFEALKEGRLGLTTKFPVSTKAWQMGGSKMFLKEGDSVSVEDLIRGVVVQSGNDACIVLAEGMAGTEAEFANRMTKRARQLGMTNSIFANSTGWPHPDHRMSARDLVFIARNMIQEFPEYYTYFAEKTFEWEGIVQDNRNPLLNLDIGADGLKTGHTEEAGYGLVGSVEQDGRRIVFMLTGLASAKDRAIESERLTSWAFREFSTETLIEKGAVVTQADVWLGDADTVDLVADEDLNILVPYADRDDIKVNVVYQGPIQAPIEAGTKVAEMIVTVPGLSDRVFDLHAGSTVSSGGFLSRVFASAQILSRKIVDAARSNGQ